MILLRHVCGVCVSVSCILDLLRSKHFSVRHSMMVRTEDDEVVYGILPTFSPEDYVMNVYNRIESADDAGSSVSLDDKTNRIICRLASELKAYPNVHALS